MRLKPIQPIAAITNRITSTTAKDAANLRPMVKDENMVLEARYHGHKTIFAAGIGHDAPAL
ncbi:hypothetical protein [Halochromatium sp.]